MSVSSPIRVAFDVSESVKGAAVPLHLVAHVFVPTTVSAPLPVVFCEHGGSYTWRYYHLEVPEHAADEYSMAHFLAAHGCLVIAFDNLGVGESQCEIDGREITPEVQAEANHHMVQQVRDRLRAGTLVPQLPAQEQIVLYGIGHSMGALGASVQQARKQSYDAVALLGWGINIEYPASFPAELAQSVGVAVSPTDPPFVLVDKSFRAGMNANGYIHISRQPLHLFFHADDVPADVIAADDLYNAPLPAGIALYFTNGMETLIGYFSQITVPLFLGNGEKDISNAFRSEASYFPNARDVTLFELEGSSHCHNFAPTRKHLWQRIVRWIEATSEERLARETPKA